MNNKKSNIKIVYMIFIFLIGALTGWIYEEIFYYFTEGTLGNRGVLYGPWLPIYGTGAVLIYFLKPLKKHPVFIFLLVMLITGVLEYVVGLYVLKVDNIRLWDYRGLFLNIQGFVCLRSVLTFALGGLMLIYMVDPMLNKIVCKVENNKLILACRILVVVFIVDIIVSSMYRTPIMY